MSQNCLTTKKLRLWPPGKTGCESQPSAVPLWWFAGECPSSALGHHFISQHHWMIHFHLFIGLDVDAQLSPKLPSKTGLRTQCPRSPLRCPTAVPLHPTGPPQWPPQKWCRHRPRCPGVVLFVCVICLCWLKSFLFWENVWIHSWFPVFVGFFLPMPVLWTTQPSSWL